MTVARATRCAFRFLLTALSVLQWACAVQPRLVNHSFEFDAIWDSPDIEILSYRYGTSRMTNSSLEERRYGIANQRTAINGPMPPGDSLHVKWRVKATGVVVDDTVELRDKLPSDLTDHRLYVVVRNTQLHVYLITPQRRAAGDAPGPLRMFSHLKVLSVYPDGPK